MYSKCFPLYKYTRDLDSQTNTPSPSLPFPSFVIPTENTSHHTLHTQLLFFSLHYLILFPL